MNSEAYRELLRPLGFVDLKLGKTLKHPGCAVPSMYFNQNKTQGVYFAALPRDKEMFPGDLWKVIPTQKPKDDERRRHSVVPLPGKEQAAFVNLVERCQPHANRIAMGESPMQGTRESDGARTPAPLIDDVGDDDVSEVGIVGSVQMTVYRKLRDTSVSQGVKSAHNFECQLCGATIVLPNGLRYAEAHHIQPLGGEHNGPDRRENVLCLCPNHHVELDYAVREFTLADLRCADGHAVGTEFVEYHNRRVLRLRAQPLGNTATSATQL